MKKNARKVALYAVGYNPGMETRARATDATHSEIKTQMERRRQQSKEIKE